MNEYAACERQSVAGGTETRYVRLTDDRFDAGDVLPWLEENGFVKRTVTRVGVEDVLHGWGTTYFAVPYERTVVR